MSVRHSLAAPSFAAEPRQRTALAQDDARYFSAAEHAAPSSSSRASGVRASFNGPFAYGGGEPDPMREWLRPTKREDPTKCSVRPPPFHVDTLKAILRAASQGKLGATTVATLARGAPSSSSSSSSSRQQGRQSLDSGMARLAGAAQPHADRKTGASTSSLLHTLQNVADDTSYQAHFDKIRSSPPALPAETERGARDYADTPAEESKQPGVRPQLTDTGHGSRVREGRLHKQASRDTNSRHMDSVLTAHHQALRRHTAAQAASLSTRKNKPTNVAALEAAIARQLPAGITGLRHALRQADPSHSGLVNFEEFKSVLSNKTGGHAAHSSHPAHSFTHDELKAVFDACSSDCMGKGAVNHAETWRHDARYSEGRALHIESFAERLGAAAPASAKEAEALRTMKKVLHASNKQSDPMRVFSQFVDPQQLADPSAATVRGVVVGHVLPQQLKEGLESIGAALTDREFSCLLQAVQPGADGKISLADFDSVLHRNVAEHSQQSLQARRAAVESNPRYSRTFHVSEAVHSHIEPEFAPMVSSRLGRGDGMKWGKLQGKLQESCGNFASAFRNASTPGFVDIDVDGDSSCGAGEIVDTMSRMSTTSTPSHRPAAAGRRSLTVVRPSSAPAGGARRSRSLTDYYRGGAGVALSLGADSGSVNASLVAGTRPNRSFRDDSSLPPAAASTASRSLSTSLPAAASKGSGVVPVSRLRDVLSDAGVQLGADDAARLEDLVRRSLASRPAPQSASATSGSSSGSGAAVSSTDGPTVSLDRFCEIVGIAKVPHATQRNAVELTDPRSLPADGGVFSHSLVASSAATQMRPNRRLASASVDGEGGGIDGGSMRATDQLLRLRDQQAENQLVNFSTTYMSEEALRQPTPTHADGSRRRVVPRPEAQFAHATQPSLFWEMQHATNGRDIFPCNQKSMRDPWQPDDFVSGYSLMRHLDKRPISASATAYTMHDTPGGRSGRSRSKSPARFKATSPSHIPSPVQILMRGRGSGAGSELDQSVQFQPSAAVVRSARKRASSAPAGVRLQQTVGDVVFGSRNSMVAQPTSSGYSGGGGNGSSGESKSGDAPGMMRWASKSLADFIDSRGSSSAAQQQQQQPKYSLRRGAQTRAGSLGDSLVPTAVNTSGLSGSGSGSGQSITAHSVTGGAPYSVNVL